MAVNKCPGYLRSMNLRACSDGGDKLILTAPFASLVHMAPYHYCSGFSCYWYEYHLTLCGFEIVELTANGDCLTVTEQ